MYSFVTTHLSNGHDKGLSFAWPLAGCGSVCWRSTFTASILIHSGQAFMQNIPLIYFWVINHSKTLWPKASTFVCFLFCGGALKLGLKLGQGLAVALPRSVSWWDSPRTDWRMDVQGAHSCDDRRFLAVIRELNQDWQPGVFLLCCGLSIGLFGLPHGMEAGLQERLFKDTGSVSWLVRLCLEFGTVSLVLYSIVKALKEPV